MRRSGKGVGSPRSLVPERRSPSGDASLSVTPLSGHPQTTRPYSRLGPSFSVSISKWSQSDLAHNNSSPMNLVFQLPDSPKSGDSTGSCAKTSICWLWAKVAPANLERTTNIRTACADEAILPFGLEQDGNGDGAELGSTLIFPIWGHCQQGLAAG